MVIAFMFLWLTCPVVAFFITVRLVCAIFSKKVWTQIQKHPVSHLIWGGYGYFGTLLAILDSRSKCDKMVG